MILPKIRDPKFITLRRGGVLKDETHHLLALWAADCAEHVLHLFTAVGTEDPRPYNAILAARAWAKGEINMTTSRALGGHAMAAARDQRGAARFAAFAAGQAGVTAHVAAHELGAAAYAIKAIRASVPAERALSAGLEERDWQRSILPDALRELVIEDQIKRNELCWFVFDPQSDDTILMKKSGKINGGSA